MFPLSMPVHGRTGNIQQFRLTPETSALFFSVPEVIGASSVAQRKQNGTNTLHFL